MITDFKLFELKGSEKYDILYKDSEITVIVVKSFDSCKDYGKNTDWCSNNIDGFYKHNETANMYRFIFSDGYKLRLTWDYIERSAAINSFSGGSHWGSGGVVNGKSIPYNYIRPKDNNEPFLFYYNKSDQRQFMVNRIESIPQKVINIVTDYQTRHSLEKSQNLNIMYKEIQKIKIISVIENGFEHGHTIHDIVFEYKNKKYTAKTYSLNAISISNKLTKIFNKYGIFDKYNTLKTYMIDKIKDFIKKEKLNENISKDKIITTEYIYYCGMNCEKQICNYDEGIENFTEDDYNDFLNHGEMWDEYYDYAIEHFDISWQTTKKNQIEIWTKAHDHTIFISDDNFDDEDDIKNLVTNKLGLYFNIIENENHIKYIKKQTRKKFNL